jgi:hypothetical protein
MERPTYTFILSDTNGVKGDFDLGRPHSCGPDNPCLEVLGLELSMAMGASGVTETRAPQGTAGRQGADGEGSPRGRGEQSESPSAATVSDCGVLDKETGRRVCWTSREAGPETGWARLRPFLLSSWPYWCQTICRDDLPKNFDDPPWQGMNEQGTSPDTLRGPKASRAGFAFALEVLHEIWLDLQYIFYWLMTPLIGAPPHLPKGDRTPVVIVPGFCGRPRAFTLMQAKLNAAGHPTYIFESGWNMGCIIGKAHGLSDFVTDLGLEECIVIGHSM